MLAAASAQANGLERINMQMRTLPGMTAMPTAGMERLKVTTADNASRMKADAIKAGLTVTANETEADKTGEKVSKHLLEYGQEGFDLFDQPARCLSQMRDTGKTGVEMLACQQFTELAQDGKDIRHAVMRYLVGDITIYFETWTKDGTETFKIEQYSFLVSPSGELKEAMKTIFAAGADEMPIEVMPAEQFNPTDPVIRAVYKSIASDVLKTAPRLQI